MHVDVTPFGTTRSGVAVHKIELADPDGVAVHLTDHGATLVAVRVPDRAGRLADVVLGFGDVAGYEAHADLYFGSTVGRVANRIAGARFALDGETFSLAANEGRNHLHGGVHESLDKVAWSFAAGTERGAGRVDFHYTSPHLAEGYPGTVRFDVRYTLGEGAELRIDFAATTDRMTPVNLTNHACWNLAGHGHGTVHDHDLAVQASLYTPTDEHLIPTGGFSPVVGTPLDLRAGRRLGDGIDALRDTAAGGYDHNFVLDAAAGEPALAARLWEPRGGRVLELFTTAPALQVYSGNFLRGCAGKDGAVYRRNGGVCLEAQRFPDAVHHPVFPSVLLHPGETFRQTTIHRFAVE